MQVENDNEHTVPPTAEESSEDEEDELFVEEDMEVSPLLPPTEFREPDNVTSFVRLRMSRVTCGLNKGPALRRVGR